MPNVGNATETAPSVFISDSCVGSPVETAIHYDTLVTKNDSVAIVTDSVVVDTVAAKTYDPEDVLAGIVTQPTVNLDSVARAAKKSINPKHLIVPLSLMAVGTFGVYNGWFRHVDNSVRDAMDRLRGDHYFHADDYLQYLPVVAYVGLGFTGVKTKHSFKERFAVGATAYLAMTAIVNVAKYSIGERRPDSMARNSFPSGHTATVFTGAELMREEYGNGIGAAAYAVATGVAFLRLYNGRHWLNDVIAGAGVGILSARIGYWMLPLYQRWFKWGEKASSKSMVAAPSYNAFNRSLAMNFSMTF